VIPEAAQSAAKAPNSYPALHPGDALELTFMPSWQFLILAGIPLADVNQDAVFCADVDFDPMLPDNPIDKKKHKKKTKYKPKQDRGGRS
jgi:hypothetical protein